MSKIIMIIAIAICGVVVIALIWTLAKRIIENMNGKAALIALVIMLVVVGALAFFAFAPRGKDSIFSSSVEGSEEGDASSDTGVESGKDGTGTGFDIKDALEGNASGDDTVYVVIHGDSISIGNRVFDGTETFRAAAGSLKKDDAKLCLVDDYAFAETYKSASKILDELGFEYSKETR